MKASKDYPREFYKYLRRKGLAGKDCTRRLGSWSSTEVLDFVREACLGLWAPPHRCDSVFTFSANSSLSGAPFPCVLPMCRLSNLDSTARFAAFYADKVYIKNPFEKYLYLDSTNDLVLTRILGDILCLQYVKPLLKAGLISIQNNVWLLCEHCEAEAQAFEREIDKSLSRARRQLIKRYSRDVKVEVVARDGEVFLSYSGPEDLLGHGAIDLVGQLPDVLLEGCEPGNRRELTRREIRESDLFSIFVDTSCQDLFQQSASAKVYRTQYLTDSDVELDLVQSLDKPEISRLSRALVAGLSHSVPTVDDAPLDRLVALRQKEGEAFEVYRDKLHSVIRQAKSLDPQAMGQLIDDEISPEIHRIERTIKNARKLLFQSLTHEVLIGVGYVGIGLCSGLLSPKAAEIVAALSGFSFAKSVATTAIQLGSEPEEVLESPYYFLWKARKPKRHH